MIAAYHHHGSARKAGKVLNLHHATVSRILRENGVEVLHGHSINALPRSRKERYASKMNNWFDANRETRRLPEDPKKLAEMSPFTERSIRSWISRNFKRLAEPLKELPNLKTVDTELETAKGEKVHTSEIDSYTYEIDVPNLEYMVSATLLDTRKVLFPIPNIGAWTDYLTKHGTREYPHRECGGQHEATDHAVTDGLSS